MIGLPFDTLSTARRLREKGLPQEQAEAIADEIRMGISVDISHLATKDDLQREITEIKTTMATKSDLRELEMRMELMKRDFTIRLGSMIMALGGVLIAVKNF
jgi:hypothetical protein